MYDRVEYIKDNIVHSILKRLDDREQKKPKYMNIFLNNSGQIIYALLRIFMFSEDNNIYIYLFAPHSDRSLDVIWKRTIFERAGNGGMSLRLEIFDRNEVVFRRSSLLFR
ncbi:hypothetical protein ACFFRR_008204 [Megaselia abdita]